MGQSNMVGRGVVSDKHPGDAPDVADGIAIEFRAYSDIPAAIIGALIEK